MRKDLYSMIKKEMVRKKLVSTTDLILKPLTRAIFKVQLNIRESFLTSNRPDQRKIFEKMESLKVTD